MVYASDNTNVVRWLRKRSTPHRWCRHLLRVLTQIEVTHDFSLVAVYVRTYNNRFNDDLTQLPAADLPAACKASSTSWSVMDGKVGACRPSRCPVQPLNSHQPCATDELPKDPRPDGRRKTGSPLFGFSGCGPSACFGHLGRDGVRARIQPSGPRGAEWVKLRGWTERGPLDIAVIQIEKDDRVAEAWEREESRSAAVVCIIAPEGCWSDLLLDGSAAPVPRSRRDRIPRFQQRTFCTTPQ